MNRKRRRKCRHCKNLYLPDPRTKDRQHYCSSPDCKKASKAASQKKWLSQPSNRNYFRGPDQVRRVQQYWEVHPEVRRRSRRLKKKRLQDDCITQTIGVKVTTGLLAHFGLQDGCLLQPSFAVGLISSLTGFALQDDIAGSIQRMHARGQQILGIGPGIGTRRGAYDHQTSAVAASTKACSESVQLGRSPPGP